jgi:uncharacterized membrane-anchored protein YitT (DUF2179 family)
MHRFIKQIIKLNFLGKLFSFQLGRGKISNYRFAKKIRNIELSVIRLVKDCVLISLGVLAAGFGLKGFLLPNQFIDGGAVGISLLIAEISPLSLSQILLIVSAPFVILGWKTISREFAIKTAVGIAALALAVVVIPYPEITHDKLLISVFGGFFLGMGIGLAVRGGGVIDGTEVLAINLSRKLGVTMGDVILIINIIIFSIAAYVLSVETALYSILTYLAASKTVDFIIEGLEEFTGVTIVSVHSEEIEDMISNKLGRGVTTYKGDKGIGNRGVKDHEVRIVFTVITRLEIGKLHLEIDKIDPHAFVVMHRIKDTKGGMIKKRSLSH